MSKMNSTLAATFLSLVLAVPALGGVIGSPGYVPPPPPPAEATYENSSSPDSSEPGDMDSTELISPELVDVLIALLFLI